MSQNDPTRPEAFWGEAMADEEPRREARYPLVAVQTAIAWRVLRRHLRPGLRILDVGAGTGRYSLPLAAEGHAVTHLDLSAAMLARARRAAAARGLRLAFAQGDVRDLSRFPERHFDLTLCLDAPVSYAYPQHERALAEVCRVTAETVVLMVSNRTGIVPFMVDLDLSGEYVPEAARGEVDPFWLTQGSLERGVDDVPDAVRPYLAAEGKLTPPDYAFTVGELTGLVEAAGFAVVELGGPGALARSIRPEHLERVLADEALFARFLDFSMRFDFDAHALGLGAVNLLLVGRRRAGAARKPADGA